ncbi:hypothetical protein KATP_11210 [Kluyvera ascorbata]|nr:hypothetical protein KATP_11210 [Kluyvera ascorbata]
MWFMIAITFIVIVMFPDKEGPSRNDVAGEGRSLREMRGSD